MKRRRSIAIVGAGRFGSALALALRRAGYKVTEVVAQTHPASRRRARSLASAVQARLVTLAFDPISADVIWLSVPDGQIASVAERLALGERDWRGKVFLHSSGSLTSDELRVLRSRGAKVASAHPLMTFVTRARPAFTGVPFAVEGDREAARKVKEIVKHLGAESYSISKKEKAAYHAWATFISPLLTALLAVSEQVARTGGIPSVEARRRSAAILRQTIENYVRIGAAASFSGPIIRGDAATVVKHLQELKALPHAERAYRALASAAVQVLPAKNRQELEKVLKPASKKGNRNKKRGST